MARLLNVAFNTLAVIGWVLVPIVIVWLHHYGAL